MHDKRFAILPYSKKNNWKIWTFKIELYQTCRFTYNNTETLFFVVIVMVKDYTPHLGVTGLNPRLLYDLLLYLEMNGHG